MKLVNDQGMPQPLALFYILLHEGAHTEDAYQVVHSLLCAAAEAQGFINEHPELDLDSDEGFEEFEEAHSEFAELLLEARSQCEEEGIPLFSMSSVFEMGMGFQSADDVPALHEIAQRAGDVLRIAIPLYDPPRHLGLAAIFWQGLQAVFVQEASVPHILSILSEQLKDRAELIAPVADSLLGAGMIWELLEEDDEDLPVMVAEFIEMYWPIYNEEEDDDFFDEDVMGADVQKIATPGVEREEGWLYFLTEEGNVARQLRKGGDTEVVAETRVVREPGYMYYLDSAGDVARVPFMVPLGEEEL